MSHSNEPDPDPHHQNSYTQTLDSLSNWCTASSVDDHHHSHNPSATISSDPLSHDSDWFSDSDSDRDMTRLVTELFDRRSGESIAFDGPSSGTDPFSDFDFENGGDFGSDHVDELGLGFGVETEPNGNNSLADGLRVAGIDSDSDTVFDSEDEIDEIIGLNLENNGDDSITRVEESNSHSHWDSFESFEWEEVQERALTMVIDEVEELSVSSGFSTGEEDRDFFSEDQEEQYADVLPRNIEWEILLGRNMSLEHEYDLGDHTLTAEYDAVFEQLVENESAMRGSPPAAKRFVESLPFVELKVEDLVKGNVVCAVCKEEIAVEEKVRRLPCWHYYHGDCIVPWLRMRNTCPVCRFELPTDDEEYERRKREGGVARDSQVRIDYEMFA